MKNLKLRFVVGVILVTLSSLSSAQDVVIASLDKKVAASSIEKIVTAGEEIEAKKKAEEEDAPALTFSGSVDTYFRSTFKTQNVFGGAFAPSTSFADSKGFAIGMVNLITSYGGDKAGFTADLVFGPRGKAAVFGTASGQAIINQAFAYYKFSDKITLNLGQFNTFLGYEVISPTVNFHYSTSYLFSWGPFNHTGARLDFISENGLVAKLAVMNPTDVVEFNPVDTYTLGAQLGKTSDKGGIWLNFLYGDQDGKLGDDAIFGDASAGSLFQADVTLGYSLSETFYLGFNSSMQRVASGEVANATNDVVDAGGDATSFLGFAVYPKLTFSESFALGLRAEYFSVTNGHLQIFGTDEQAIDGSEMGKGSVMAFTLTGNYKTGGLTFIPEVRIDKTSEDSFIKDSKAKDMMPSLTLAAVYKF